MITSAAAPGDRAKPTQAAPLPHVSEYLVLGPFAAEKDVGVYVRLPGKADPNTQTLDLAARGSELVLINADFVAVRGFEIRHGAQFHQRAQVALNGEGLLLDGCLIRDSEVRGISFICQKDQTAAPIVIRNAWALCVGIEASPGPNLIANNLSVNLRPGPVWFREAILSWSTDRNWAVNNTIDGRWNPLPAWQGLVGADGLYLGEGGPNRGTPWCPLDNRRQAYLNNLVVGCHSTVRAKPEDLVAANVADQGTGAVHLDQLPAFVNPEREDYRLKPSSTLNGLGVENEQTKLARHDFHGLLRFPDVGRTVGAFRFEPTPKPDAVTLVEVEFRDGTMRRLYDIQPHAAVKTYNILQADRVFELPVVGRDWKDKPEYVLDGKLLWRVSWHGKSNTLKATVGCRKADWGGLRTWDETAAAFKDTLDGHAQLAAEKIGHRFGSGGPARPILSFIAPQDGKYLLYTQNGKQALWGQHTALALNVVPFAQGAAEGKSVLYFQTDAKHRQPLRANVVVDMNAGDELALVHDTNASGGGGGSFFAGYHFKVGYLAR